MVSPSILVKEDSRNMEESNVLAREERKKFRRLQKSFGFLKRKGKAKEKGEVTETVQRLLNIVATSCFYVLKVL